MEKRAYYLARAGLKIRRFMSGRGRRSRSPNDSPREKGAVARHTGLKAYPISKLEFARFHYLAPFEGPPRAQSPILVLPVIDNFVRSEKIFFPF